MATYIVAAMNSGTPWIGPDQAARHLITTAQEMLLALATKNTESFNVADAELLSTATRLELSPSDAAQTVGVLAGKLVKAMLEDAIAGKPRLVEALSDGSLTGDPNANYFVTLSMRVTMAAAKDDEGAKRQSWNELTTSLDNLSTQPQVAARAARALAVRLAMAETSSMIANIRDRGQ